MDYIEKLLEKIRALGLYPRIRKVSSAARPLVTVDGREVLSFCSNNYLGLATDPGVIAASIEGTKKYGTSCGGSRLISGNIELQEELEAELAGLKGVEAVITFMTGYMANTGVIPMLMEGIDFPGLPSIKPENSLIVSDQLNHASIIDACRLTKTPRAIYRHKDLADLEKILGENQKKRKLIVTDGVFSMDGDIAPLPGIVALAKKYQAMVMVDDAHATGTLGANGGGTIEHFNLRGQVDVVMGTCSKSLGGVGGFIAGSVALVDFLRIRARSYIFSSALPPGTAAGLIAAAKAIRARPELRRALWANVDRMKSGLKRLGFDTLGSETQILPIAIGREETAIKMADRLFDQGIFLPCVRWPAVPQGQSRLRCTVMATHTPEQIDRALEILGATGRELGLR